MLPLAHHFKGQGLVFTFHQEKAWREDYDKIVNHNLSLKGFESRWEAMINKYGVAKNETLSNLYQIRHLWVSGLPTSWTNDALKHILCDVHVIDGMAYIAKSAQ
jgi:hypothetical protein